MTSRPSDEATWLAVAETVARRSRCTRSRVGCVLVGADGRVVATGYNGPPAGYSLAADGRPCSAWCSRHDTPSGAPDFSDCPSVHAELNALLYSDRRQREGGTAYITRDPCWACTVALAASGVARVVVPAHEDECFDVARFARACEYLRACGLTVATA